MVIVPFEATTVCFRHPRADEELAVELDITIIVLSMFLSILASQSFSFLTAPLAGNTACTFPHCS